MENGNWQQWKINCKTKNVIYHLGCSKGCVVFEEGYQGETKRELRARINEHRAGIRKAVKNKDVNHSIYGHFVTGHGKNPEAYLEVIGIERVFPRGNDLIRKARESFWINEYDSISYGATQGSEPEICLFKNQKTRKI